MHTKYTAKNIAQFWGKIDKERSNIFYNGSRCWEWIGSTIPKGYGQIWIMGSRLYVHRLAYEIEFGEIPEGLLVCHHCDNPSCVNPLHLFLGTHQDNAMDRTQKGRAFDNSGESNGQCVLSNEQVSDIRRRYGWYGKGGEDTRTLAKAFGVSPQHIWEIVKNKVRT